jgi:hypothetical protein
LDRIIGTSKNLLQITLNLKVIICLNISTKVEVIYATRVKPLDGFQIKAFLHELLKIMWPEA